MVLNKLLVFLGFCPSRESAKNFKIKKSESTELETRWKPNKMMTYLGVIPSIFGCIPYYFEDTSISGVTDTIILHGKIGAASFVLGLILIVFGNIIPRTITMIRNLEA